MVQSFTEKDKKKAIAEESLKTRKAREKLKRQLEAFDKKITPQALEKKTIQIHRWIARHAQNRVVLKTKSICLFDENQNTAELSQRVRSLEHHLKKEHEPASRGNAAQFYDKLKQKGVILQDTP